MKPVPNFEIADYAWVLIHPAFVGPVSAILGAAAGVAIPRFFDRSKPKLFHHEMKGTMRNTQDIEIPDELNAKIESSIPLPRIGSNVITLGFATELFSEAYGYRAQLQNVSDKIPQILELLSGAKSDTEIEDALLEAFAWSAIADIIIIELCRSIRTVPNKSTRTSSQQYFAGIQDSAPGEKSKNGTVIFNVRHRTLRFGSNLSAPWNRPRVEPLVQRLEDGDCGAICELFAGLDVRAADEIRLLDDILRDLQKLIRYKSLVLAQGTVANWGKRPFIIQPDGVLEFKTDSGGKYSFEADVNVYVGGGGDQDRYNIVRGCAVVPGDATLKIILDSRKLLEESSSFLEVLASSNAGTLSARIVLSIIMQGKEKSVALASDWSKVDLFPGKEHIVNIEI